MANLSYSGDPYSVTSNTVCNSTGSGANISSLLRKQSRGADVSKPMTRYGRHSFLRNGASASFVSSSSIHSRPGRARLGHADGHDPRWGLRLLTYGEVFYAATQALCYDTRGLQSAREENQELIVAQPGGRILAPAAAPGGPAPNGVIAIVGFLSFVRNPPLPLQYILLIRSESRLAGGVGGPVYWFVDIISAMTRGCR